MQPPVHAVGSARALLDRASAIAQEKCVRVSTLHLAAAWIEQGGEPSRVLVSRGCRTEDLRLANKVHTEEVGTIERIQSRAKRIAAERKAELSSLDLVLAALTDKHTALTSWVQQLGCEPNSLAEEVYRATIRAASARAGSQVPTQRNASPSINAIPTNAPALSDNKRPDRHPSLLPPQDGAKVAHPQKVKATQSSHGAQPTAAQAPTKSNANQREIIGSSGPSAANAANGAANNAQQSANAIQRGPKPNAKQPPVKTPFDIDPRTFPAVAMFARNLSAECARGLLEPVVGREREVGRVLDAVGRRDGRGALLVGAPGVGKSTLLRAVARSLESRSVLALRHADFAAQARGPSGAERARKLVEELVQLGDRIVLALDPISPWFLTRDVPDDIVLELRAALTAQKLAWIGACTPEEARKVSEIEPWMERHATRLGIEEPTSEQLRSIVDAYAPLIATHHGVVAEPPVLRFAAELSERYLAGRAQPDRTLSVIDLALSRARRAQAPALARDTVAAVVAEVGGLPPERVSSTDHERLLSLETTLAGKLVGHQHAIRRVSDTLRRNAVGFRGTRPIGTFLFLGPTGVGKTECAKAIAEALFPGAGAMTRFDMAEFSEAHSVSRLVGAPPGYVGYNDGGQLTDAVRKRPYQLILLDEIEKAHRDVLESLLALLDEGRMTDGRGRTADFRNTVIVMTSNLGADIFEAKPKAPERRIGFGADSASPAAHDAQALTERVRDAARAAMPPELWNRIDEPIVFSPLAREDLREIARRMLADSFARLRAERGVSLSAGKGLIEHLLDQGGYDPSLGARPMRRAIARLVEAPVADAVLRGQLEAGDEGVVDTRDGQVEVLVSSRGR
ncbi:MAG: ATP-dependent Clp protease ATP-binding subunit [Myxococcales bacterium]|nr:ATP-dependent Clp protease ATP-binding subunit [Myxococcales bacterium]